MSENDLNENKGEYLKKKPNIWEKKPFIAFECF